LDDERMPTARRNRRIGQGAIWVCIAIAMLAHGAVLAGVQVFDLDIAGEGFSGGKGTLAENDPDIELQTTCSGDVLLATAARAASCLAPWRADAEQCVGDIEMTMWMDLSSCRGQTDAIAAVAMITPRAAEKLTQIDPEQLIEEMQAKPPEQKPPPPVPPPQPQQQPPPPPPAPPAPAKPSQVVETVKPNDEKDPENARFLAEYSTRVEKQKVARGARNEPMVAKSKPEELAVKDKPKDEPSVEKLEDKPEGKNEKAPETPGQLSMRKPGAIAPSEQPQDQKTRGAANNTKNPLVGDGFVPRRGDGAVEQQRRDPGEQTRGEAGAGGGAPRVPDLKESKDVLERIAGGGSVDHLEEIDSGDETALSAKRWVYASFFNRLKRQVAQNWDPATVWRRTDPQGTHHGFKTRVTEVRVSLSPQGKLVKIVVTAPSGVTELDDEAVRAFHASSPFPNPPDGLVKDNQITFAFSFYFEIGQSRTSWRVIRQ
jgi:TonB family protein